MYKFNKQYRSQKNIGSVQVKTPKTLGLAGWVFAGLLCTAPMISYAAPNLASYDKQLTQITASLTADNNQIKKIERTLWSLDRKILEQRKTLRKERTSNRTAYHDAKREVKRQTFEAQRIQNSIRLLDKDIQLTLRDTQRSTDYHNSLNPFKRQLESEAHDAKIAQNNQKANQLQTEKTKQEAELETIAVNSEAAQQKLLALQTQRKDSTLDLDPRLQSILVQRETKATLIISLRKQVKRNRSLLTKTKGNRLELANHIKLANNAPAPAAITPTRTQKERQKTAEKPEFASYVFAVSGEYDQDIEETLQLKEWVESYEAKYIQANWNGFEGIDNSTSTTLFKEQFEKHLNKIHQDANIILIGHGRGGGAAIEAATNVASKLNRTIEFLAVIDPIGDGNLRANIVFNNQQAQCTTPKNDDRIINTEYIDCIKDAERREITSNIKHFYNRWQKDNEGPLDFQRRISIVDANGENVESPTATGRFSTSAMIEADQKRVFIGEGKDAHKTLLAQASRTLPKLLVKHLR
ncbi:hypothetical protein A9Q81_02945 [Gammaproteobacteria bacterium 42_54_T18]|nr:hypothetical protein A9Q81_02945 [Gammaproteobacteria bacterium 42_54_T18]